MNLFKKYSITPRVLLSFRSPKDARHWCEQRQLDRGREIMNDVLKDVEPTYTMPEWKGHWHKGVAPVA